MTTEPTEPPADGDTDAPSVEPETLDLGSTDERRSSNRPLLVVAAVIAVVAIGAGVFALTRGDDESQNVAAGDGSSGAAPALDAIWNSTWELVALERDGEPWAVEVNGEIGPVLTTTAPGAEAIGYHACNQGTGRATVEDGRLVITEFRMTAAACVVDGDDASSDGDGLVNALMDQEEFVRELLTDRPTIAVSRSRATGDDDGTTGWINVAPNQAVVYGPDAGIGDRLTLTTAKGSATFERTEMGGPLDGSTGTTDPQAIWGRMWNVQSITSGGKPKFVAMPLDGSPLRLDASIAGRLDFNGCNGAGGAFDLDEGSRLMVIEIGPRTMMACEQALMDQDDWLQDFLGAEPTVTMSGNRLTLATTEATIELDSAGVVVGGPVDPPAPNDPDGSVSSPPQIPADPGVPGSIGPDGSDDLPPPLLPPSNPAGLWGRTWTVDKITDGGRERPLIDPTDGFSLRLEATTTGATGTTGYAKFNGCNGAGGLFDLDQDHLVMTQELDTSTAGRCLSDDVMAQEAWLQAFLAAGPTITIDVDHLTLTTDQATIDLVLVSAEGQPVGG